MNTPYPDYTVLADAYRAGFIDACNRRHPGDGYIWDSNEAEAAYTDGYDAGMDETTGGAWVA